MKPTLIANGAMRLKLKYDESLSKFAFKFNSRRSTQGVTSGENAMVAAVTGRREAEEADAPLAGDVPEDEDGMVEGGDDEVGRCSLTLPNPR
jgi:hypothetical protein